MILDLNAPADSAAHGGTAHGGTERTSPQESARPSPDATITDAHAAGADIPIPPDDAQARPLQGLSIPRRLFLAFTLLFVLAAAVCLWGMRRIDVIVSTTRDSQQTLAVIQAVEAVRTAMLDQETGLRGYIVAGDPTFLEPTRQAMQSQESRLARLEALTQGDTEQQRRVDTLRAEVRDWQDGYANPTLTMAADPSTRALARDQARALGGKRAMDAVRATLDAIATAEREMLDQDLVRQRNAQSEGLQGVVVGGLLIVATAIGIWVLLSRSLVLPIVALTTALRGIARGDITIAITGAGRGDELGTMARALQSLKEQKQARERQRAERQALERRMLATVQESRERLDSILNSLEDGVLTINEAGVILSTNRAGAAMLGRDVRQLLGLPVDDFLTLPSLEGASAAASAVLERAAGPLWLPLALEGISPREVEVRGGDRRFPAELTVTTTQLDDHPLYTLVLRDITHRKEVERMKDAFISTVSHELRTPLTSIHGSIRLALGMPDALSVQAQNLLRIADRNSERLIAIVNDLLDIERIESGTLDLKADTLDLAELAAETVDTLRPMAEDHTVTLRHTAAGPLPVVGDPRRLRQVLANLVSNGIKYSNPGGVVTVLGEMADGRVRLSVHDNGPGVPDWFKPRLFQKFAQADSSDSRQKGGNGLGLSIVKAIVERHGGDMTLTSHPGDTEFVLTLPSGRLDAQPDARSGADTPPPP
ncbi:CHASE3 domain-containing protein [Nitrospirillum sp. BR 11164]|uniref:ATP-binding protein n=1 Tax=Nitrospirillum sp. BR 11164 TaxID=3104324 RepID=UPI002AFFC920|nr:ATP-binding protein [Nitrospirillum sp. BR 11164]MEA1650530.1 CHASE3 domain-containing protein [Nitrospirillum sp. BR 11164]